MSGSGRTIIAAGSGVMNVSGGTHSLNRVLQNDGTVNWNSGYCGIKSGNQPSLTRLPWAGADSEEAPNLFIESTAPPLLNASELALPVINRARAVVFSASTLGTVKLLLVSGLIILVGFGRDLVGKPAEHVVRCESVKTPDARRILRNPAQESSCQFAF